ncbi:hypothetical protein N7524_009971 [Penicillium chrysogenum]|nr:hypothetical protein N7524_009971 [Penicillium chrysogenum]
MGSGNGDSVDQFAILTPRLVIVPTPTAISFNSYRALYSDLHANVERVILSVVGGLGDFAVGLRGPSTFGPDNHSTQNDDFTTLKGDDYLRVAGLNNIDLATSEWVGYAGLRDATTTSMPLRVPGDPALPSWVKMIELRYGVSPKFWGQGIAQEASKAIMQWSVDERGIKRFIAETERENSRSAKLLQKLGFTPSGTDYWKEPSELEWKCAAR